MKLHVDDIGGDIVKDTDVYLLKDNTTLKNLVLSSTRLKPNKSTRGHKHDGCEEVYYFINGSGTMELDEKIIMVDPGDVVLVEDGVFHRVHASQAGCYFICIFNEKRSH